MTDTHAILADIGADVLESAFSSGSAPIDRHPDARLKAIDSVCENIRQALQGLQFGEITITVRNGSVVQIERIARKRQFKNSQRE